MNNLQQIRFLCRVAYRAGYRAGRHGDLGAMLFSDHALFERAATYWRKRHGGAS